MSVNPPDRFKRLADVPEARRLSTRLMPQVVRLLAVLHNPDSFTQDIEPLAEEVYRASVEIADLLFDSDWFDDQRIILGPDPKPPVHRA